MSSINLHDAFMPIYINSLKNTAHILKKGAEFAEKKRISESEVLNWRIAPDMNNLEFQVTNTCDIARNFIRIVLARSVTEAYSSKLSSFASLQTLLAETITLLESTKRESFDGRDVAMVDVQALGMRMPGLKYVQEFGLPNFYFHSSMVYALFRGKGAPIGKWDYLKGGR